MTPVDMSPEEEKGLRELQAELAGLDKSPWQPRVVSTAFTSRSGHAFTLTMQGWIDLDFVKSPLLNGGLPTSVAELEDALAAFKHSACSPAKLEPHEAAVLARRMRAAVDRAFATSLKMRNPRVQSESMDNDGFGGWVLILAALISGLGMSRTDALECPVDQAFAILAGDKHNKGWIVSAENYRSREVKG